MTFNERLFMELSRCSAFWQESPRCAHLPEGARICFVRMNTGEHLVQARTLLFLSCRLASPCSCLQASTAHMMAMALAFLS